MVAAIDPGHVGVRVAALVVTYDRPDDLRLVIAALRGQTRPVDEIIVLDNHGPVPAAEILHEHAAAVTIIRSDANLGGAGGFAKGLAHAASLPVDWVWLMDDDAVPEPDALAALLTVLPTMPARTGALCCAVREFGALALRHRRLFGRWFGGERPLGPAAYARPWSEIDTGSFVGFLVSVEAVRAVGLPNPDFFLAYDDTEYSLRLRAAGWRLCLVPASVIAHGRTRQSRLRTSEFGAKHYFNIRNRLVVKRWYAKYWGIAVLRDILFAGVLWLLCRGVSQPGSLRLLGRALGDGLGCRLGPLPAAGDSSSQGG
ncbi:MAG: glycosyltransferase [Thermodesulfobacteriota bacterium]